ncbi:Calmodulin binding protein-like [Euphorbia peplus]|nr:Calmodulin binding protein-like [Euphorbia peplus]
MAAKRFMEEQSGGSDIDDHHHQPAEKRIRTTVRPSLASVIGEAVMMNSLHNFCKALEPMIRRVVTEEVEGTLQRLSTRPLMRLPSLQIQAPIPLQSNLQLIFRRNLALPIFTGSKIVDSQGDSLQILLVETMNCGQTVQTSLPHPIKVEIVVLDGDFPSYDENNWTNETFDSKILKERTGKRPLLAGDCLTVTLRDGIASIGEIEFTDNSSWIRGRKFRIGARVVPASSPAVPIREAITHAFVVKDHRGELYKKHHPPMLDDEVWRLEKIGKDGAFHKKLSSDNINSVQDFLKLSIVDPQKLRRILGPGMSEKMWEVTIKHARKCVMGNKHYIMQGHDYSVTFNPICQVVNATINGQTYSTTDLPSINRGYIESLVREANANWSSLQEVVGVSSDIGLLTQGKQEYASELNQIVKAIDQIECNSSSAHIQMGYMINSWQNGVALSPGIHYSISGGSSSDGDLTPRSSNYIRDI